VQPPAGVERVAERQQIELIGAASVVEHEQAVGLTVGGPLAETQLRHCARRSVCEGIRRQGSGSGHAPARGRRAGDYPAGR
jgi:hypothetical protein